MVVIKRKIEDMTTYDFKRDFIMLDDSTDGTLAKQLYQLLGTEVDGNTVKLYGWYLSLKENGTLVLDEADTTLLRGIIEGSKRIGIMLKGQFLNVLKTPS